MTPRLVRAEVSPQKGGIEPLTTCKGLKLVVADGMWHLTNSLPQKEMLALMEAILCRGVVPFINMVHEQQGHFGCQDPLQG